MASRYAAHPATRVEQAKEAGPKDGPNETIRAHLFCKPATDGVSVGDCPFTHYARMALAIAGMEYIETPLAPGDKPGGISKSTAGPCPAGRRGGSTTARAPSRTAAPSRRWPIAGVAADDAGAGRGAAACSSGSPST
ncbi:chloride channel [Aureococcus anophagefferens]|uniref:Chloride channel n=1 Tax=Aureococcus anophagefferens TaxID=44056 RepID=A0ABR1GAJ9_AURAN